MEGIPKKTLLPEGYSYHPEGYLWYELAVERFSELPETVNVDDEILSKKTEFHVTIVNARGIARDIARSDVREQQRIEKQLQSMLADYIHSTPIQLEAFEDDLRLATTGERTSIAARCRMKNVQGYFDLIKAEYGKEYPVQPPHVSFYTKNGMAVGIDSNETMESFKKIELPEVQSVLNSI